jgi:hypothetical protein
MDAILMEKVIVCPICNDENHCFEEMQEDYSSFMCFHCGFMSDTRFTEANEALITMDTTVLVNKLRTFDEERKIWWFPSVVNMGKMGIIFPEGNENSWSWKFARVVDIPKENREKFKGYEQRLDVENAKRYDKWDFISACKDMGITKDLGEEKN